MKKFNLLVLAFVALFAVGANATTYYGVGKTLIRADGLSEQGEHGGQLRIAYDTIEAGASIAVGDVYQMGSLLPDGARVVDAVIFFDDLDTGSSCTLNFGWAASAELTGASATEAADADGFMASVDVYTAAGSQSMQGDQPTVAGNLKKFTASVQPQVTAVTTNNSTATGTISTLIFYYTD